MLAPATVGAGPSCVELPVQTKTSSGVVSNPSRLLTVTLVYFSAGQLPPAPAETVTLWLPGSVRVMVDFVLPDAVADFSTPSTVHLTVTPLLWETESVADPQSPVCVTTMSLRPVASFVTVHFS